MRPKLLIAPLVGALFIATPAAAETPPRAAEIADQIESPFCPGRTLTDCTSINAAGWRNDIRVWVDEGVPSPEIKRRLEERAGRDLAVVPDAGTSLTLALMVLFAAFAALALVLRYLVKKKPPAAPSASPQDDAYDQKLDEELAQLD